MAPSPDDSDPQCPSLMKDEGRINTLVDYGNTYVSSWSLHEVSSPKTKIHLRVVDVIVYSNSPSDITKEHLELDVRKSSSETAKLALGYVTTNSRRLLSPLNREVGVKFILPYCNGYLLQSDFIQQRMQGCNLIENCRGFLSANSYMQLDEPAPAQGPSFLDVISSAVGALVINSKPGSQLRSDMAVVDEELAVRLSFPWIMTSPLRQNRLVVVGSRHRLVMSDWFESAYNLGIRITLVGPEGHFLQHQSTHYLAVEQYLALDMTPNTGFVERIAKALNDDGNPFNGITTFKDVYLTHVAEVAKLLGLSAAPLDAVKTCVDKHLTRELVQSCIKPQRIKGAHELKERLKSIALTYPLIVKPCNGYGSEGVFRANDESELYRAVSKLELGSDGRHVLIDTFVDGPEVDANFVLLDEEILFFEVVDGFPCTAEDEHLEGGDFLETDQMWPSNHPPAEKELLCKELHSLLLRLGFSDGIFHVEARVQNSEMQYIIQGGVKDLRPHDRHPKLQPNCFLIEINQRPPGHGGFTATKWTYGLDYLALCSLCALGAKEQVRALAHPFGFPSGAQGWCNTVFINAEKPGIYDGGDIPDQVRALRPELMADVAFSACYYDHGDVVTDDPPRIALFVVASRFSRRHVREVAQAIREVAQPFVKMK